MNDFNNLPLHDAVVESVVFSPAESSVTVKGFFFCPPGKDAVRGQLVFTGVRYIEIPHQAPWGSSTSINTGREDTIHEFILEMQSGDEIKVIANDWSFGLSGANNSQKRTPEDG